MTQATPTKTIHIAEARIDAPAAAELFGADFKSIITAPVALLFSLNDHARANDLLRLYEDMDTLL